MIHGTELYLFLFSNDPLTNRMLIRKMMTIKMNFSVKFQDTIYPLQSKFTTIPLHNKIQSVIKCPITNFQNQHLSHSQEKEISLLKQQAHSTQCNMHTFKSIIMNLLEFFKTLNIKPLQGLDILNISLISNTLITHSILIFKEAYFWRWCQQLYEKHF
jgi:hypothetical protein